MASVASVAAAQQASAVGKYNQAIQERNAVVAEQESERLEQQLEKRVNTEYELYGDDND